MLGHSCFDLLASCIGCSKVRMQSSGTRFSQSQQTPLPAPVRSDATEVLVASISGQFSLTRACTSCSPRWESRSIHASGMAEKLVG